ncbi:MAG: hypothetical protein COA61_005635 [Zetaproteobacteria bacterium]|nr:hypothetical protein [Zetaproteobacteria bacterium]
MHIDFWQLLASIAGIAFTFGFIDQIRVTYKTRNVHGLSMMQWLVFFAASAIFTAYYIHLEQWLMVVISIFGTLCCLMIVSMIIKYKEA